MSIRALEDARVTAHGVLGDVRRLIVTLPAPLLSPRELWLYLPPRYARSAGAYPVCCLHDGQHLFGKAQAFAAGDRGVDDAAEALVA